MPPCGHCRHTARRTEAVGLSRSTFYKPLLLTIAAFKFTGPRTAKLKLKLTGAGRRLLKHANSLKLAAEGSFASAPGQSAVVVIRRFTVRRR
ncbi:MAG: hypothetical protein ACR2HD_10485 [Solirubrobacteraceae bacterium]